MCSGRLNIFRYSVIFLLLFALLVMLMPVGITSSAFFAPPVEFGFFEAMISSLGVHGATMMEEFQLVQNTMLYAAPRLSSSQIAFLNALTRDGLRIIANGFDLVAFSDAVIGILNIIYDYFSSYYGEIPIIEDALLPFDSLPFPIIDDSVTDITSFLEFAVTPEVYDDGAGYRSTVFLDGLGGITIGFQIAYSAGKVFVRYDDVTYFPVQIGIGIIPSYLITYYKPDPLADILVPQIHFFDGNNLLFEKSFDEYQLELSDFTAESEVIIDNTLSFEGVMYFWTDGISSNVTDVPFVPYPSYIDSVIAAPDSVYTGSQSQTLESYDYVPGVNEGQYTGVLGGISSLLNRINNTLLDWFMNIVGWLKSIVDWLRSIWNLLSSGLSGILDAVAFKFPFTGTILSFIQSIGDWFSGAAFHFSSIWHYVVAWVGSLGSGWSFISSVWSVLPYPMVLPVYASAVVIIVLHIFKRFFQG